MPGDLTNPAYGGDAAKLRFVECGNSVAALNDYLFASGLSLKGCGSNNGQTIAGAHRTLNGLLQGCNAYHARIIGEFQQQAPHPVLPGVGKIGPL